MSLSKIALFAFGLAAVLVIGLPRADAAQRHTRVYGYPSALNPGALVYGPEDALFERAKGGLGY
ncbi:MAG: hypothetical protein R3D62_17290 [Xanthobacteraceae bacterium]